MNYMNRRVCVVSMEETYVDNLEDANGKPNPDAWQA
jgi:hypothetical protein